MKAGHKVAPEVRRAFEDFDANDNGGEFRGMSIPDLARMSVGNRARTVTANRAIEMAIDQTRAAGSNTISDFAGALENTMYKTLLGQYATVDDTWAVFLRHRQRSGLPSLEPLPPRQLPGARHACGRWNSRTCRSPMPWKFSITTETRGNMIAISRQALINDDMGAIASQAGSFGRAAALSIEKAVYALLALGSGLGPTVTVNGNTAPFFDATFGNVGAGGVNCRSLPSKQTVCSWRSNRIRTRTEYLSLRADVASRADRPRRRGEGDQSRHVRSYGCDRQPLRAAEHRRGFVQEHRRHAAPVWHPSLHVRRPRDLPSDRRRVPQR